MSTLRANTLSDASGSNSVPMATVASGTAKAWVNFNGTGTVAIRAAFNVSSITDNGVGDYTVNFTTDMQDTNYVPVFGAEAESVYPSEIRCAGAHYNTRATNSLRIRTGTYGSNALDVPGVYVAIFR